MSTKKQKLHKSLTEKWIVRITTKDPEASYFDGVVVHITAQFIVLYMETKFEFDGFVVLPQKAIKSVRDGKYERCWNAVLHHNGQIKTVHTPHWLATCETIPQVLYHLKQQNIWPGVEIISRCVKEPINIYYIGPLTRLEETTFFIDYYNGTGKWEKEYELEYDEILQICFGGRYEEHFNAYMRSQKAGL